MTQRAYLRLSPSTFHDKAVVDRYPPHAFATFCAVLCLAEEQPERGRFRSERLLRLLLDEPMDGVRLGWGKWVPFLIEHGDLSRQPDGSLYLSGWDEWQEGDVTVAERMKRLRAKKGNGADRNATGNRVTPDTVTVPSDGPRNSGGGGGSISGGGGGSGRVDPSPPVSDDDDHLDAWYRLTASWPSPKVLPWLNELAANHGPARLSVALAEELAVDDDRRSLLSRTQTRLEASAHAAEKARRRAEADQAAAERDRIDAMPPEQRAANMARLRDGLVASGLITADERGTR